jgi:hypothetical protein
MRENYLAFVVRPAGPSWDVLVFDNSCGPTQPRFDVPRGRVPHGRDVDEVIRRDLARYDVVLREQIAVLGNEPILETRRRTVYLYRANDATPVSWNKRVSSGTRRRRGARANDRQDGRR